MKLYIHIPFCKSKCAYCDFYSTPRLELMESFVDSAINEWKSRSKGLDEPIDTLYLGGGTPSSLPPQLLSRLLSALPLTDAIREATIEANPDDISPEWVSFITGETPFRRVSMGIQSFSDTELSAISRRHSAADAVKAFETLRAGGIDNISCDLIYGLPGQDCRSWEKSLERLIDMRPEHISAYLLSYEPGTRLYARLSQGKVAEADEDTVEKMYSILCSKTAEAGYGHYEISNFALPGREAVHNSSYWDGSPYIGLGPGAHSWDGKCRSYNPSNLKDYINAGGVGFGVIEEEDDDNRFNDMIITRLRTRRGLLLSEIREQFGESVLNDFLADSRPLEKEGLLTVTEDGRYSVPEEKWLMSNSILLPLIRV